MASLIVALVRFVVDWLLIDGLAVAVENEVRTTLR